MTYGVRLETRTGLQHTAVVRLRARQSELSRVVPDACGRVWNVMRARQVARAGRHVALYLDDQINLEVGVELTAPFAGDGEVVASKLPRGEIAWTSHLGPYGGLRGAHEAIRDWAARHGRALAGPNWEVYDHWREEWNRDPSRIRTDVFYLLEPASERT